MNIRTFDYDDKKLSKETLNEAIQTLQFLSLFVDIEEATKMEKTCELLISHLHYIETLNQLD